MGKLTVEQIITVDGYAADINGGLEFFEAVDFGDSDRTDSEQMQWLKSVDAILLGANTYRMFAGFWPQADVKVHAVAEPINRLSKFVFSNSMDRAAWGEREIEVLRGDAAQSIEALKRRFDSIVLWGSLKLANSLFESELVDTLRLRLVPVLIGNGLPFTPKSLSQQPMRLVNSYQHSTGHVTLTYDLKR